MTEFLNKRNKMVIFMVVTCRRWLLTRGGLHERVDCAYKIEIRDNYCPVVTVYNLL